MTSSTLLIIPAQHTDHTTLKHDVMLMKHEEEDHARRHLGKIAIEKSRKTGHSDLVVFRPPVFLLPYTVTDHTTPHTET